MDIEYVKQLRNTYNTYSNKPAEQVMSSAISGMFELYSQMKSVTSNIQFYVKSMYAYILGNVGVSEKAGINIPNIIRLVGYTMKYNELRKMQAILLDLRKTQPDAVRVEKKKGDKETINFVSNIEKNVIDKLRAHRTDENDFFAPPILDENQKIVSEAKKFTDVTNIMELLKNHATRFYEFKGLNIITHQSICNLFCSDS